jgi:hypothetical protein
MTTLVRAQLLALRTTRALPVTAAVLVVFTLVAVIGTAFMPGDPPSDGTALTVLVRLPAELVAGACLVLGVLLVGGEHRHRTRVLSALAEPHRGRLLSAQLAALAVTGAATAALVWLVAAVAGAAVLSNEGVPLDLATAGPWQVLVASSLAAALLAALGGALGGAVGGTAGALGLVGGWFLVAEGIVPVVLRRPELADQLPGGALSALVAAGPGADRPLSPAGGALALLVLTAVVGLVAAGAGRRREL